MGKNSGKGYRTGPVKNRVQSYNPKTGMYVKRDTETGKILGCKQTPYKNVRKYSKTEKK